MEKFILRRDLVVGQWVLSGIGLRFSSNTQSRLVFFEKKEEQIRLHAFLQDHPHQPLNDVALSA
jgi:hypothetical protein